MNKSQNDILSAKLDCIIDLVGLNGELVKCTLAAQTGANDKYERTAEKYDKMFHEIIQKCFERMQKAGGSPRFDKLSVEDAQKLNEAARQTCEFEATSEVGDEA